MNKIIYTILLTLYFNNMSIAGNTIYQRSAQTDSLLKSYNGKELEVSEIAALTILGLNPLVFGLPGANIIELDKKLLKHKIPSILAKHEAHAVFAAEGYNAVSQIPAFVTVTSGPGFANAIAGIYDAYMENYSLILISGNAPLDILRNNKIKDLQKIDIQYLGNTISKKVISVPDCHSFQNCLIDAFILACQKPYGPIIIEVPSDLFLKKAKFTYFPQIVIENENTLIEEEIIRNALNIILNAKKPFIVIGKEMLNAKKEVWQLIEKLAAPFGYSLNAKGILPDDHPQNYGLVGRVGRKSTNQALYDADLVIIIGDYEGAHTFPNETNFTKGKKIMINFTKENRIEDDISLMGNIKTICHKLATNLNCKNQRERLLNWNRKIKKSFKKEKFYDSNQKGISPIKAFQVLNKYYNPDILILDVGENAQWAARLIDFKANIYNKDALYGNTDSNFIDSYKKQIICSSGPAETLGTAISYTLGAHLASKKSTLLTIVGDGGLEMQLSALWLLSSNNVPAPCILINNEEYAEIDEYGLGRDKNYFIKTVKLKDGPLGFTKIPIFKFLADMYNMDYYKAITYNQLDQFTEKIKNFTKPYLFEILTYPLAAYPHIPLNGTFKDIIEHP